ncbi:MAG: FAD-dependent oxidoreductase [Patescibacteria group bacterium]|jgi:hypothetical protein
MFFPITVDVLIIGGGIAGLWLLDDLRRKGYSALLVESKALGSGQTIAAQGILHGGVKHLLVGRSASFVDALQSMPSVWRDCLDGVREPDLRDVRLRSGHCVCWRTSSLLSFLGLMGARFVMQSGVRVIAESERPLPLRECTGDVYRVNEQVIDPSSLLSVFAKRNQTYLLKSKGLRFYYEIPANIACVDVFSPDGESWCEVTATTIVLTAGEGNAALRTSCGLSSQLMRRLPLPILVMSGDLPDLNGFCLEGHRAKVIITTHRISKRFAVWQIASEQLVENGETFESLVTRELREAMPGFSWGDVTVDSYEVNRAEGITGSSMRSNDAHVVKEGNVITAWPTKLVLAPRLSERVMELLPSPSFTDDAASRGVSVWPRPHVAAFPWDSK